MILDLPKELLIKILEYDPTYHTFQQKAVQEELKSILFLRNSFRNCLSDIILSPWCRQEILRRFTKKQLLQYAKTYNIYVYRRTTKARLLLFILWFHLHTNGTIH